MRVLKFGGTSVKDADAIKRVHQICSKYDEKIIIVVSACSGITNKLVNIITSLKKRDYTLAIEFADEVYNYHTTICKELNLQQYVYDFLEFKRSELKQLIYALEVLGEISLKSADKILSSGELLSSKIIYEYFKQKGLNIEFCYAMDILVTNSSFTEADVDFEKSSVRINNIVPKLFKNFDIIITQGFIGSDENDNITTLGRGGSDYSASVIASLCNSDRLEIWTDVDGIMTSDPRIIPNAALIKKLSYVEAAELAYFGAKVLHPKTIYPAVKNNIPVVVLNTFRPDLPGTVIVEELSGKNVIKAIAFRKGITIININSNRMLGAYGFLSRVFNIFEKYETSVDIVTTSEVNISLTIDDEKNLNLVMRDLKELADVVITRNQAIIAVIGEGIRDTAGIAARFFGVLKDVNISMVSVGASEVNLSIIIDENDLDNAVNMLHTEFFKYPIDESIFMNYSDQV